MRFETRHPDDGQLLRYADGELPARKTRQVRRHLEACWECRAALEELEAAVSECVRYRKKVVAAHLPPPPAPWQDLSRGFERIDAEQERGAFGARLLRAVFPAPVRWTAAAAAALALLAVAAYQWRQTPSVRAATLLRKAVAAADARPKRARRVRVKTRNREFTRAVGTTRTDPDAPIVEALFRSARYDWDDPLSAKAYASWRDSLPEKEDEVAVVEGAGASGGSFYRISTTTGDGELVAARLTLRMTDLEPAEGRFEFRDREWVEITELVDLSGPPASEVAEATGGIPSEPAMPPNPPAAAAAPRAAGIAEELRAVAALHDVGADLGEPLEITRSGAQVLVSGTGVPPRRQRQIQEALAPLPNVEVRFSDNPAPALPAGQQPQPAASESAAPNRAPGQSRLQEKLGGRVPFERFSSQLLDRSDAAMARAYALKRMAQQFPPESEEEMSAADRKLLRGMAREHATGLERAVEQIDAAVSPLLNPRVETPPALRPGAAAWQAAADETLSAARQVETSLAALLGMAPSEAGADAASRYAAGMARLKVSLDRCQRLLSYDDVRQSK